jgi:hypothetical protein
LHDFMETVAAVNSRDELEQIWEETTGAIGK